MITSFIAKFLLKSKTLDKRYLNSHQQKAKEAVDTDMRSLYYPSIVLSYRQAEQNFNKLYRMLSIASSSQQIKNSNIIVIWTPLIRRQHVKISLSVHLSVSGSDFLITTWLMCDKCDQYRVVFEIRISYELIQMPQEVMVLYQPIFL